MRPAAGRRNWLRGADSKRIRQQTRGGRRSVSRSVPAPVMRRRKRPMHGMRVAPPTSTIRSMGAEAGAAPAPAPAPASAPSSSRRPARCQRHETRRCQRRVRCGASEGSPCRQPVGGKAAGSGCARFARSARGERMAGAVARVPCRRNISAASRLRLGYSSALGEGAQIGREGHPGGRRHVEDRGNQPQQQRPADGLEPACRGRVAEPAIALPRAGGSASPRTCGARE